MSVAANQGRTLLGLLAALRPHWRRDPALPARIQSLLARRREFGSRDRRLYRELVYTTLRHLPWIEPLLDADPPEALRRIAWLAADLPATRAFRAAFATGEPPAGDCAELLPGWFHAHCPEIFAGAELAAQLRRAPLWLRVRLPAANAVAAELRERGWEFSPSPVLPSAWRLLAEADVTTTDSWRRGAVEVQDLGSQLILEAAGIEPGKCWLDACAGAGGKTLQLADLLGPAGAIDAHDVRPDALAELERRAQRSSTAAAEAIPRARIRIVETPASGAAYDGVLVDAPCSGSGTWRRAPHLKWTITPEQIERAAGEQQRLLAQLAAFVAAGGRLVYATCSLSARENEDVVARFLADHPEFAPEPVVQTFPAERRGAGHLILPGRHDSDGFFVAVLRRRS